MSLPSASVDMSLQDIAYKWNHVLSFMSGFFYLACFQGSSMLCQVPFLFYCQVIFLVGLYSILFDRLGLFPLFGCSEEWFYTYL